LKTIWGNIFKKFPKGVIYSIEFEGGTSIENHESNLNWLVINWATSHQGVEQS